MPIEHTQWSVGEELRSTGAHNLFLHLLLRVRIHHHEDDHLRAGSEVERGSHDSLHWLVSVAGWSGEWEGVHLVRVCRGVVGGVGRGSPG